MTLALGTVPAGTTLYIPFSSYAGATGASVTMTGLAVSDVEIFKNGSVTQRASDNGYTLLDTDGIDFDGITGLHGFSIDLNDNSDSGFYSVGASYMVAVSAVTVDGQTVNFWAAVFRIGPAESVAGYPKVDAQYVEGVDATNQIRDSAQQADTLQRLITVLEPASGSPNEYRFSLDALRHMPALIWGAERTNYTVAGSFGQYVPANTTHFGGTAGTFSAGRPEVNTTHAAGTAWGSGAITAASIAADAITDAKVASDVTIASVTGAVGSVTGNVGGNVTGSIGSVATGGITANSIAADAIGSSELAASAVSEIAAGVRSELAVELARIDLDISSRAAQADLDIIGDAMQDRFDIVEGVLAKYDTMVEAASGSPGDWQYRADALRNAPAGSGGGGASAGDIATAVWSNGTRTLTAIDEDSTTLDLDATIRSAIGMASANLDTQLAAIDDAVDTEIGSLVTSIGTLNGNVSAILVTTVKVDTTLQAAGGSPGDWEFSADALRRAPTGSGGSGGGLDAADIRAAVGLASANLDTQLSGINAKTTNLPSDPADQSLVIAATTAIYDRIGAPAGASVSADVAAVKAQTVAIEADTQDIQSRIPAALVGGKIDSTNSDTVGSGTVGTGSTTTSIVTSAFSPAGAVADQMKGRIVIFDNDTATAALRGQATDITASSNSSTPTLTVTALTIAPSSGDVFTVV